LTVSAEWPTDARRVSDHQCVPRCQLDDVARSGRSDLPTTRAD